MNAAENLDLASGEAETFLSMFGGKLTFQTFGERHKAPSLNCVLHGSFHLHKGRLEALNQKGAGIFVMVNEGDGNGRTKANVVRVRAYFVDLDGAPLAPVQKAPLQPHIIVQSSPGKWHAYWFVEDAPLDQFRKVQRALAEMFAGDPKVCDLPRVMRLPGYLHQKAKPALVEVKSLSSSNPYAHAEFLAAFGLGRRELPEAIGEGDRNTTLYSLARGLVQRGHEPAQVNQRLQKINAERCQPPLCATEVDQIVSSALASSANGFIILPHKLLDSREWKQLPAASHRIILTAYRRYDGSNNGNIALPWSEFEGLPGFSRDKTFYSHRDRAVQSGILIQVGRSGRAALYAINPKWLVG